MSNFFETYTYLSSLLEDIAGVKLHYSHIPEEDFDKIIRLDPTFKESKNTVGTYGKWLLELYRKDNPLNTNIDVFNLLSKYDELKKDKTKAIEKDISKFKSLEALQNAVNTVSDSDAVMAFKKAEDDYEVVFEDKYYIIYVPNTYQASMKLGKNTSWCTAGNNGGHKEDPQQAKEFFDSYINQYGGKYYIIADKQTPILKYQFHWESKQFMNWCDQRISTGDLRDIDSLQNFFESLGYSWDTINETFYEEENEDELHEEIYDIDYVRENPDNFLCGNLIFDFIDFDMDVSEGEVAQYIQLGEIESEYIHDLNISTPHYLFNSIGRISLSTFEDDNYFSFSLVNDNILLNLGSLTCDTIDGVESAASYFAQNLCLLEKAIWFIDESEVDYETWRVKESDMVFSFTHYSNETVEEGTEIEVMIPIDIFYKSPYASGINLRIKDIQGKQHKIQDISFSDLQKTVNKFI